MFGGRAGGRGPGVPSHRVALAAKPSRMDVTSFVLDQFGHFSAFDLPRLLFALVLAVLLTAVLAWLQGAEGRTHLRSLVLWSMLAAAGTALVRGQLPVAVVLLALVVLVRPRPNEGPPSLLLFAALVIGMGCGSGASLVTAFLAVPLFLVARWARPGEQA